MLEVGGERYYNAACAARYLGISRFQFYYNIRPRLQRHKLPGCGWWLYKGVDLDALNQVQVVEPAELAS